MSLKERSSCAELSDRMGFVPNEVVVCEGRLRWFGQVEWKRTAGLRGILNMDLEDGTDSLDINSC